MQAFAFRSADTGRFLYVKAVKINREAKSGGVIRCPLQGFRINGLKSTLFNLIQIVDLYAMYFDKFFFGRFKTVDADDAQVPGGNFWGGTADIFQFRQAVAQQGAYRLAMPPSAIFSLMGCFTGMRIKMGIYPDQTEI